MGLGGEGPPEVPDTPNLPSSESSAVAYASQGCQDKEHDEEYAHRSSSNSAGPLAMRSSAASCAARRWTARSSIHSTSSMNCTVPGQFRSLAWVSVFTTFSSPAVGAEFQPHVSKSFCTLNPHVRTSFLFLPDSRYGRTYRLFSMIHQYDLNPGKTIRAAVHRGRGTFDDVREIFRLRIGARQCLS